MAIASQSRAGAERLPAGDEAAGPHRRRGAALRARFRRGRLLQPLDIESAFAVGASARCEVALGFSGGAIPARVRWLDRIGDRHEQAALIAWSDAEAPQCTGWFMPARADMEHLVGASTVRKWLRKLDLPSKGKDSNSARACGVSDLDQAGQHGDLLLLAVLRPQSLGPRPASARTLTQADLAFVSRRPAGKLR